MDISGYEPINVDSTSSFEETSYMKLHAPKGQGTDAALEQLIKRSKKGVKVKVVSVSVFISDCIFGHFYSTWITEVGTRNSGRWQIIFLSRKNLKEMQVSVNIQELT